MPSNLSEGITLGRISSATFSLLWRARSATLIRQRQQANGSANQFHNVISNIGDRWRSHSGLSTSMSRYCHPFIPRPHRGIVPSLRRLYLSLFSFLRWNISAHPPSFLCAASLLANGRCSPRAAVHDHHPLTLIRQRSHHIVACSFEISVSVTRDGGRRAAGCS